MTFGRSQIFCHWWLWTFPHQYAFYILPRNHNEKNSRQLSPLLNLLMPREMQKGTISWVYVISTENHSR